MRSSRLVLVLSSLLDINNARQWLVEISSNGYCHCCLPCRRAPRRALLWNSAQLISEHCNPATGRCRAKGATSGRFRLHALGASFNSLMVIGRASVWARFGAGPAGLAGARPSINQVDAKCHPARLSGDQCVPARTHLQTHLSLR